MKNGKEKGSEFEREVGRRLSRWITKGKRKDLFSRTAASGAVFTFKSYGEAGDLSAIDPLGFPLLDRFVVEAKHWKSLNLGAFLLKYGDLYKEFIKLIATAKKKKKFWMYVVKQNNLPVYVMLPSTAFLTFWPVCELINGLIPELVIHTLFDNSNLSIGCRCIYFMKLDDLLASIRYEDFFKMIVPKEEVVKVRLNLLSVLNS